MTAVVAAEPSLPPDQVAAAFDAAIASPAALRMVAAAIADDPAVLHTGAPAVVGRLVTELVARGSVTFTTPACATCGRTDRPLTPSKVGGVCPRCRTHQLAQACAECHTVAPVVSRDAGGGAVCARCTKPPRRRCGICGATNAIARRARGTDPDVCVNCFRMPTATCSRCARRRPCSFAATDRPVCTGCAPRRTTTCAHCKRLRPAVTHWTEGPVCVACYDAALARRGTCADCRTVRRLVDPPGATATRCCDCAGVASVGHVCADCGIEDKLFAAGRCARCALAHRTTELLADGTGKVPDRLSGVAAAITATPTPRTALNWLHKGAAAAVLADVAAGRVELSHEALDAHPRRRTADYLRRMLVAGGALDDRDEDVARTRRFVDELIAGLDDRGHQRLVQTYATWRVMRRLRRRAEHNPRPTTATHHIRNHLKAAVALLAWLDERATTLADATQGDIDAWLTTGASAYQARDFVLWATETRRCPPLTIPIVVTRTGTAMDSDVRWGIVRRLLHDDSLAPTDRVAGCLVLLYGQQLTRITAITRDQVTPHDDGVTVLLGVDPVVVPEPLAGLITDLITNSRSYVGVGSPAPSRWLFPGLDPDRPLTASRLGERLGELGINGRAARRAALNDLAGQLPAGVLAELLGITDGTAVRWVHNAGGNWNRYAAQLAHDRSTP